MNVFYYLTLIATLNAESDTGMASCSKKALRLHNFYWKLFCQKLPLIDHVDFTKKWALEQLFDYLLICIFDPLFSKIHGSGLCKTKNWSVIAIYDCQKQFMIAKWD